MSSSTDDAMYSTPRYALGFENAPEQREPVALRVRGTMPPWLTGSLYRTGPGCYRIPSEAAPGGMMSIPHWFDGLGMHHHFEIQSGGTVMYNNRLAAEAQMKKVEREGAFSGVSFGRTDPCKKIFDKFFTEFRPPPPPTTPPPPPGPTDHNVSVTLSPDMPGFSNHTALPADAQHYIMAKTDANALQLLEAETLEPLAITGYQQLDPRLDGRLSAAHSCWDRATGEFFNYTLKFGQPCTYTVFKVRDLPKEQAAPGQLSAQTEILAEISDAPPAYLHSFVMTQKYVVLCVWQSDFAHGGLALEAHRNYVDAIEDWNLERAALFYVIDRAGGLVSKFQAPAFFCFHAINAFDSGDDDIVIDLSAYDDHAVLNMLYLDNLRRLHDKDHITAWGRPRRFVLENVRRQQPAGDGALPAAKIAYSSQYIAELPTINPMLYHKPYRYAYGISQENEDPHLFVTAVAKVDMADPGAPPKYWSAPTLTPGEPVFIARPGGTAEDDGVVLVVMLDGQLRRSVLVVLDAASMTEVARAEMETLVPFGFHGAFVPKPTA